jgi:hypothetical protein
MGEGQMVARTEAAAVRTRGGFTRRGGSGVKRERARVLAGLVPKRDLLHAETASATIVVATHPHVHQPLAPGDYALALVDPVLYLARMNGVDADPRVPRHARLRLAEAELAMAFGGPPFHSTLHLAHPAVGRLVISLDAIEFAHLTEAAVLRAWEPSGRRREGA